jgi:hypothetical protein
MRCRQSEKGLVPVDEKFIGPFCVVDGFSVTASAFSDQHIHRPRATIHGPRRTIRQHIVVVPQPDIELAL